MFEVMNDHVRALELVSSSHPVEFKELQLIRVGNQRQQLGYQAMHLQLMQLERLIVHLKRAEGYQDYLQVYGKEGNMHTSFG